MTSKESASKHRNSLKLIRQAFSAVHLSQSTNTSLIKNALTHVYIRRSKCELIKDTIHTLNLCLLIKVM